MTATEAPPDAPAPQSPERTLASVASDGVAFLVYWLVILLLLGQAVTSVLRPPDGVVAVGLVAGLVCLVWATFCLTMGVLRGKGPDGADVPPPGWLVVITSAGCLISLVILRSAAGRPARGPQRSWPQASWWPRSPCGAAPVWEVPPRSSWPRCCSSSPQWLGGRSAPAHIHRGCGARDRDPGCRLLGGAGPVGAGPHRPGPAALPGPTRPGAGPGACGPRLGAGRGRSGAFAARHCLEHAGDHCCPR